MRTSVLVLSIAVLLCSAPRSEATPIVIDVAGIPVPATLGAPLAVVADGDVMARLLGRFAVFEHELLLEPSLTVIFDTSLVPSGVPLPSGPATGPVSLETLLGTTFTAGDVLTFRLHVDDSLLSTTYDFFTGPASGNFDGVPHAAVADTIPPALIAAFLAATGVDLTGHTIVAFEDVPLGHPFYEPDYNDLIFAFTNLAPAAVPEPTALLLLGTGVAGLLARARRRSK